MMLHLLLSVQQYGMDNNDGIYGDNSKCISMDGIITQHDLCCACCIP